MKKRSAAVICGVLLALFLTGCQSLMNAAAELKAEKQGLISVENLELTVEVPLAEQAGKVLALIGRDANDELLPVLVTGYNEQRGRGFDVNERIFINAGLLVACEVRHDGVLYKRCVEPAPGDLRRKGW